MRRTYIAALAKLKRKSLTKAVPAYQKIQRLYRSAKETCTNDYPLNHNYKYLHLKNLFALANKVFFVVLSKRITRVRPNSLSPHLARRASI